MNTLIVTLTHILIKYNLTEWLSPISYHSIIRTDALISINYLKPLILCRVIYLIICLKSTKVNKCSGVKSAMYASENVISRSMWVQTL